MKRIYVQSSNVASIGYDAQAGVLEVEFLNGGVYQYFEVDPQIYKDIQSFFNNIEQGEVFAQSLERVVQF